MALLNNIFIFVIDEKLTHAVKSTTHPVEDGVPLTDTVVAEPVTLSINGKIVDYGNDKAKDIISKIIKLKNEGSLITYTGRNKAKNMQIQSFNTTANNANWGSADFDMELKEVRIAKSPYKPKTTTKTATTKKPTTADIKVGSIVVFTGGNVYVSSDAKKAASKRSRSTCKVTKISKKSWSIHQYHLISTDGKGVYGWVDLSNITVSSSSQTSTNKKSNGGTQQITSNSSTNSTTTTYSGNNPWLPAYFSISEQMKIESTNPTLAKQLKSAVGVK